jgi:NAD(P)H-hydrate epimerase
MAFKLTCDHVRSLIRQRKADSNKGDYGHVLVIAGSRGMAGAAVLCAGGALRSGAGLVTAAVPESQLSVVSRYIRPEAMTLSLKETDGGSFSARSFTEINNFVVKRRVSSIVIGPGIRANRDTRQLVLKILKYFALPVVLDADALNVLSAKDFIGSGFKSRIVITPHPGELARLMGADVRYIQNDREKTVRDAALRFNVVCVLKGSKTVISDGKKVFVNPTGNPGMATGGSGDVLSGMLGALFSQVKEPRQLNAALAAVYAHGLAGDIAAKEKTEISLLAKDITENISKAFKRIING